MNGLGLNLRFAFRQLRKSPGFALTAIFTLALGIGATTAIFSLVEGVLLRPLPFHDPDRLVLLGDNLRNGPNTPVTAREIATYSEATNAFSSMGAYILNSYEITGGATPEVVNAAKLTSSVFPTLGVNPILGRVFTKQEDDGHQPFIVISYSLWLDRYHRDPDILGKPITLNRKTYSVIGVMPRSFEFPLQAGRLNQVELWLPMSFTPEDLSDQQAGFFGYHIVARVKDGVTMTQAAQDADRVGQQIVRGFPASMSAIKLRGVVTSLRDYAVADVRSTLRSLLFAVAMVLLIACVNVAGLLLVRAVRRRREYAVRLALGARPIVIVREAVFEGLMLSLAGGILGLAFAAVAVRVAVRLLPESMPRIASISVNANVAMFAIVVALISGALCSLAPAFAAMRTNLTEGLKQGDRTSTGSTSHTWLRSALVVSEIAIALMLITTSGAFLRSFEKMRGVDPGFVPDNVLIAGFQLPLNQYPTNTSADTFNREVVRRLTNEPGISSVAIANALPASGASGLSTYTVEGQPAEGWKLKFANFALTYGDYFRTMGIRLVDGRYFTENDRSDAPLVVLVNQTMAKNSWPGQSPIGKRMHVGNPNKGLPWATVIGVVADTKVGSLDQPGEEQWYGSLQQPAILFGTAGSDKLTNPAGGFVVLRSALPPEQMVQTLRSAVAQIDPLLALQQIQTMDEVIASVEAPRRFNTSLITAFAAGALLLAIIGIYAVVAFSVSMRTHEIAIRMALGAQRSHIARLVLGGGAKLTLIGCALGVIGSVAVSRLVSSFLFEVSAIDPLIYSAGVVIMMLLALLATALPAKKAASGDPVEVLRAT